MRSEGINQAGICSIQSQFTLTKLAAASMMSLALSACGGGGGGDTTSGTPTEQPTEVPSEAPAPVAGPDSFSFEPTSALAVDGALNQVSEGSSLYAAWNPSNAIASGNAGMKVAFYGAATGCSAATEGVVATLADAKLGEVSNMTGYAANAALPSMRWTPSGNTTGCDDSLKTATGASSAYVNAADSGGGVGILTSSGRQADNQVSFFGPYTATGQNGAGTNKYITGTFIAFRQKWWKADPLQPWIGTAAARIRSEQTVGAVSTESPTSGFSQAKQQMMATFLNQKCQNQFSGAQPCQLQYVLNTSIVQSNVTDWSRVSWAQNGSVWFDPVQGGMPIVEGQIYASGVATKEPTSGLELFRSQGSPVQHGTFANRTFDVTISFDALMNAIRLATASKYGVQSAAAVTDAQMAAMWGGSWNDRNAWVLLTGHVAQEVYNPESQPRVQIAGGFKSLFIGPQ